jgi:hypothetical protein
MMGKGERRESAEMMISRRIYLHAKEGRGRDKRAVEEDR